VIARRCALELKFRQLAGQCRSDRTSSKSAGAFAPIAGDIRRALDQRVDQAAAALCVAQRHFHLADRLVEQERGRDGTDPPGRGQPLQLSIELRREGGQPFQVGFGVRSIVHRMLAVEEARRIEIGADVLDHDIGRIAPTADRDIAIGQGKTVKPDREGAFHDIEAGPGSRIDRRSLQPFHLLQAIAQQGGHLGLSSMRAIAQLAPQSGVFALVDPQRGGRFRRKGNHLPGQLVEIFGSSGHGNAAQRPLATRQGKGGGARAQQGKGAAAGKRESVHGRETAVRRASCQTGGVTCPVGIAKGRA